METFQKKFSNRVIMKVLRACLLSVLFISSFTTVSFAQEEGPSLDNLKKNTAQGAKELEEIRQDEIMGYVYMVLGFLLVIAIAWFTTVKARKRTQAENEAKMRYIQQNLANKKHAHHHGHGHTVRR